MELTLLLFGCVPLIALTAAGEVRLRALDPARVDEIVPMLPEAPRGLARPITERAVWDSLAETETYRDVISRAETILTEPLPEQPDDLYLNFSRTGNRTRWQTVANSRRGRLAPLVLAECAEDRGRFLSAIEELVAAICAEPTWVIPSDAPIGNFYGERIDIDLASSALAWHYATANWLLGDQLNAKTRALMRDNVERRVLEPFRQMYAGEREPAHWISVTSNWNPVCLAGVTGAALAQIEDRRWRAESIAAAERYSQSFLDGFPPDGYCTEGLVYWNFGFGNYILLAETVRQATGGGIDLMDRPGVATPATFGARIPITGGVAPALADCMITASPSPSIMYYVTRRFGLNLPEYAAGPAGPVTGRMPEVHSFSIIEHLGLRAEYTTDSLTEAAIFGFPDWTEAPVLDGADASRGLRTWYDAGGVLIGRPAPGSDCRLGVALKGGHNAEHHNHNDLGAYVVVVEDQPVLLDPGGEIYTARTFSGRRYESLLINSFGHPVPVVAGELQRRGPDARAQVLSTQFTDSCDRLTFDLRSAYDVAELTRLERSFVYDRTGMGAFAVTDTVEFSEPRTFETALITNGECFEHEDGTLLIRDGDRAVEVTVDTDGLPWELIVEEIDEDAIAQPTRFGIRLSEPVSTATATMTIRPWTAS